MKKFSVAGSRRSCSRPSWRRCGSATTTSATHASNGSGSSRGSINVWIIDPGSPKIQGVVKQYGTDFEAAHPGTKVAIQFVPWAQAHDKFVTSIAGGKVPDVAEMGTTWTPEFADQGGLVEQPKIAKADVRLEPRRRRDAGRQGLRQAVVRRRALADLPQGHPGEGGRRSRRRTGTR